MDLFDRMLELIIRCKFSARQFFREIFGGQNLAVNECGALQFIGAQKFGG